MINEKVYKWLKDKGFEDRITEHGEKLILLSMRHSR